MSVIFQKIYHNKLFFIMEVDAVINDFDAVMRNDKAPHYLTGTVKMTKSKLSEWEIKGRNIVN